MATQPIQQIEREIYNAAQKGTTKNPRGLPSNLALLLVAQAKHETGNFTSNGFTQGNNAFGYSYVPGAVYQLSQPGRISDNGQPLATYSSVQNSVKEIVDWIYRRVSEGKFPANLSSISSPEQYAQLLKSAGYYSDSITNYTTGLVRWLQDIPATVSIGFGGLLLVVTALYIFRKQLFGSKT